MVHFFSFQLVTKLCCLQRDALQHLDLLDRFIDAALAPLLANSSLLKRLWPFWAEVNVTHWLARRCLQVSVLICRVAH